LAIKLTIKDISAGYGAVRALHGVSVQLAQGQTVALLGTNGNGKSTLMKCVMGIVKPDTGSIVLEIDGVSHDLTRMATEEIVNLGVSLVPEGRRLFPKLTVEENLRPGGRRSRATWPSRSRPSRCWRNDAASWRARCPAGSSRCWPSPGP